MSEPNEVIRVALAELGYREKASWRSLDDPSAHAGSGNYVKYSRDLEAERFYNGRKRGVPWCDIFVDWCFFKAYGAREALRLLCQPRGSTGAGCASSRGFYARAGRLRDTPSPGDQAFYYGSDGRVGHTGLVVAVGKGTFDTVEGNVNDRVCRVRHRLGSRRCAGFGHPDWKGESA